MLAFSLWSSGVAGKKRSDVTCNGPDLVSQQQSSRSTVESASLNLSLHEYLIVWMLLLRWLLDRYGRPRRVAERHESWWRFVALWLQLLVLVTLRQRRPSLVCPGSISILFVDLLLYVFRPSAQTRQILLVQYSQHLR